MTPTGEQIKKVPVTDRIRKLKEQMLSEPRVVSVEQAVLITKAYREHPSESVILKRAYALREALYGLRIVIHEGELIVGNRSAESCAGIVFPEGGLSWLKREIDILETRPQDRFQVRPEDRTVFFEELVPYWDGHTLEDKIYSRLDPAVVALEPVGKLNQKDHAQGHICPDVQTWIQKGPMGLLREAEERQKSGAKASRDYYEATCIVLKAAAHFISRYAALARALAGAAEGEAREDYLKVAQTCENLAVRPAETFHEALQSLWFLFVLLQMESNASSFSPGRADQYLYPYFRRDFDSGALALDEAQELVDALFIKFNQIVYMRNTKSAAFFAGFPIGFNIAIGGRKPDGTDAVNELSYIFLQAQEHCRLRQPNLSARLHDHSPDEFVRRISEVIGVGTGMPQVFCDEAVFDALKGAGYTDEDALNYAVVGCVELSAHGKALSFSDAAMFNMVKALELTLNDGVCMLTGHQLGLKLGDLTTFRSYEELEQAYARQLDYFIGQMEQGLQVIEAAHRECLPSPMLSSVVDDCLERGVDVTAGGAVYNTSGIQLIQVANVADSLAALKQLVYDRKTLGAADVLDGLRNDFPDEKQRLMLLNHAPKYGNDVEWVDRIGEQWIEYVKAQLDRYVNFRGGPYTVGLYTVSAHVPMGVATPDGRHSREPWRWRERRDTGAIRQAPTALLKSVSRIKSSNAANGTLLNMKFSPELFRNRKRGLKNSVRWFAASLR